MKRKGDEIAAEEGVSEYGEGAPGGSTVISGPTRQYLQEAQTQSPEILESSVRVVRFSCLTATISCILMQRLRVLLPCNLSHLICSKTPYNSQILIKKC